MKVIDYGKKYDFTKVQLTRELWDNLIYDKFR